MGDTVTVRSARSTEGEALVSSVNAPRREPADVLLDKLAAIRLKVSCEAPLAGTDIADPGIMDWQGEATLSIRPGDDESSAGWWTHANAALSAEDIGSGGLKFQVLRATGLVVDLWSVQDVFTALKARNQDYAEFLPLFGGRGSFGQLTLAEELDDMLEPGGGRVVIMSRVLLAPAWHGLRGIGSLLVARLLRWLTDDARVVALRRFPAEPNEQDADIPEIHGPAMNQAQHIWRSLAFEPFTDQVWIMDPRMSAHHQAVQSLAGQLGLTQPDR
jgi:hypothetical protein